MNRTIAFDNKKRVWKTRYSFFSSCIAWVKNLMVTAPTSTSTNKVIWKHDGSSSDNNRFYGNTASPSIIGVSFNDNPSANKQFKSVSVETDTPDLISGGLNTFVTNRKGGSIGRLKQKGGVLYGHIGSVDNITLSNFEFIGSIKEIHSSAASVEDATGIDVTSVASSAYIEFDYVEMSALSSGAAAVTNNPLAVKDGDETGVSVAGIVMYKGLLLLSDASGLAKGDDLYFAYPSGVNGESPKGQVADVTMTLGSDDFEVYALNLEYSPTNLDHNN